MTQVSKYSRCHNHGTDVENFLANIMMDYEETTMDTIPVNTNSLTTNAIEALKDAYFESTSDKAKQSIAAAYTAIALLKNSCGKSHAGNNMLEGDDYFDPGEYSAAV